MAKMPVPNYAAITEALAKHGLDANSMLAEGWTEHGYFYHFDSDGVEWRAWPSAAVYRHFLEAWYAPEE